jgi:enoyl-CoA hydratase/carnithine racemase
VSEPLLLRHVDTGIATLSLNALDDRNALSDAMLAASFAQTEVIMDETSTRVVMLRAAGKAFCASHDLREMQSGHAAPDTGAGYFRSLFDRCTAVM